MVYGDFESALIPISDIDTTTGIVPQPPADAPKKTKKEEKEERKEVAYQRHQPASYWYKIVSIDPDFNIPEKKIYVGEDAAENMLDELQADADEIFKQYIQKPKTMIYTDEDKQAFKSATECHICGGEFKPKEKKVGFLFIYFHDIFIIFQYWI